MAFLFGAANTDVIACGTGITHGATFTVAVRFKPTAADASDRKLVEFFDGASQFNVFLSFNNGSTNEVVFGFSTATGTAFPFATWASSGLAAGVVTTLVGTYDGSNLHLYSGTDATPKATLAETRTPDQVGTETFTIGNRTGGASLSAASTIYEVAWWAGTALTAAQSVQFGTGFNAMLLRPLPSSHWCLLINDTQAVDYLGGHTGTVSGATYAAQDTRIYYPAAGRTATKVRAASISLTPPVGSLLLTGVAPTLAAPISLTPLVGSLLLTGAAATLVVPSGTVGAKSVIGGGVGGAHAGQRGTVLAA